MRILSADPPAWRLRTGADDQGAMKETAELLREYWRQLHLPECPHCGDADLCPSRPRLWERPLCLLSLCPYRCLRCAHRFYLRRRGVGEVPGGED